MIFQLHFIEQVAIFNKTLLSLTKKQTSALVNTQCSNSKELRTLSRDCKITDFLKSWFIHLTPKPISSA